LEVMRSLSLKYDVAYQIIVADVLAVVNT